MENNLQKIILLDIQPEMENLIKTKLLEGYVIQSITNLQPKYDKLLIVYCNPDFI